MNSFKLAIRNLIGAGLRTWLNVFVLSLAFVIIVFYNGMLDGWNLQAHRDTKAWEIGGGEYWHLQYDPFDPYCLQDAHKMLTDSLKKCLVSGNLTPVLVTQATIYPEGRMENVLLKGIDPDQRILSLPVAQLKDTAGIVPVIIGSRMAESSGLKKGDITTLRWRDKNGTFDAREISIVDVFHCNVPSVDNGQLWIPIQILQAMTGLTNEATYLVASGQYTPEPMKGWIFRDTKFLLKDIDTVLKAKRSGSMVMQILLLAIALLAVFDTQVLAVFRRQKEIGTFIALGMTRFQVVKMFTAEGMMYSLLALILAAGYGMPFLMYLGSAGIPMPKTADSMGMAIADKIIPVYSLGMILTTISLVVISATIVSYFPTRKILHLNPTDALKGKIQ